jgi:membrane-bound ClpP family serine protease
MKMRKYLLAALLLTTSANAADMRGEAKGISNLPTLWITGDIEKGDYEKFVNWIKAARAKQWGGFIAMESPGGLIREVR